MKHLVMANAITQSYVPGPLLVRMVIREGSGKVNWNSGSTLQYTVYQVGMNTCICTHTLLHHWWIYVLLKPSPPGLTPQKKTPCINTHTQTKYYGMERTLCKDTFLCCRFFILNSWETNINTNEYMYKHRYMHTVNNNYRNALSFRIAPTHSCFPWHI